MALEMGKIFAMQAKQDFNSVFQNLYSKICFDTPIASRMMASKFFLKFAYNREHVFNSV